ncbi:uncharacterized protein LOC131669684 isoform X1 [Phymastichus coffea]|uniref:uncharacterized protein LOC131669684 isoform X1 n=1 Tax=Phymastichus coffea TaxID=108790 RepID=UPI00273B4E40|nr:uncharacterized protein LOC131669684 isoform X1 [Phymastichus coffea]
MEESTNANGKSMCFAEAILDTLSNHPETIGMIDAESGAKVTFAEMKERSVRCALWLLGLGVGESDVVAVSTPLHTNDYLPYLATLYINAVLNPWPHDPSDAIVEHFLDACRPKVIFASKESVERLAAAARRRGVSCRFALMDGEHADYPSLDDIASGQESAGGQAEAASGFRCRVPSEPRRKVSAIYLSSGTTGTPKAILLSYHCLARRYSEEYGMGVGMNCLWYASLQLNVCRSLISSAILLRCTRVLSRSHGPEETGRVVESHKVNFVYWTPYYLTSCYQARVLARRDFSTVATIAIAGAKPDGALLEECRRLLPGTFIKNSYGITEAGGLVAQQTEARRSLGSVGFACSGVELRVVDPDTGRALGANREGELHVRTDTAMLGYLGAPDKTRETLDEDGWLHTGDLGFYDERGEITVTARIKEIIRTRSLLLSSSEFEEPLMQHPAVSECAVVAVDHPVDVERPFAFVVRARHARVTAEELMEFSASRDERFRLTAGLAFVDELPYTASGKKCLRKLQEMAKAYVRQ